MLCNSAAACSMLDRGHPPEAAQISDLTAGQVLSGSTAKGCHNRERTGKLKPSGITPITTDGTPFTRIVRPSTVGSDP